MAALAERESVLQTAVLDQAAKLGGSKRGTDTLTFERCRAGLWMSRRQGKCFWQGLRSGEWLLLCRRTTTK